MMAMLWQWHIDHALHNCIFLCNIPSQKRDLPIDKLEFNILFWNMKSIKKPGYSITVSYNVMYW